MFKRIIQPGLLCIFDADHETPLKLWDKRIRDGHIKRNPSEEIKGLVLEICSKATLNNYIVCPANPKQTLGIKLSFFHMILKLTTPSFFAFDILILDDRFIRRRLRVSTTQAFVDIHPFMCRLPLSMEHGWNHITIPLCQYVREIYGTGYNQVLRVAVYANCLLKKIFFTDKDYLDEEIPPEFNVEEPDITDKYRLRYTEMIFFSKLIPKSYRDLKQTPELVKKFFDDSLFSELSSRARILPMRIKTPRRRPHSQFVLTFSPCPAIAVKSYIYRERHLGRNTVSSWDSSTKAASESASSQVSALNLRTHKTLAIDAPERRENSLLKPFFKWLRNFPKLRHLYSSNHQNKPLRMWNKRIRAGHIYQIPDQDLRCLVLEIVSSKSSRTYITCPADPTKVLGIRAPYLHFTVKNLQRSVVIDVLIKDNKNVERRFKAMTKQKETHLKPFLCKIPLTLENGWNEIVVPLQQFTRRAFGTSYVETLKVQIHASCRVQTIYFSHQPYEARFEKICPA